MAPGTLLLRTNIDIKYKLNISVQGILMKYTVYRVNLYKRKGDNGCKIHDISVLNILKGRNQNKFHQQ